MIYKQQLMVSIYLRTRFFIRFAPSEPENSFFSIKLFLISTTHLINTTYNAMQNTILNVSNNKGIEQNERSAPYVLIIEIRGIAIHKCSEKRV